ncbi:MAG TPA: hypothetical protein VI997_08680, partial [Candidatus Thermoplasmatota archaeon]|nr:hypothetical protein [Candidatus Thermoplasmatota archaeon]
AVEPDARGFALSLVPVDPLAAAPSLDAPPAWASGDWWTYHVTDELAGSDGFDVTLVVAGVEGDHWLVGMPGGAFAHDAYILHLPGIGEVGREDLGWIVHGERFAPVQFPLTEGDAWDTSFEGVPAAAKVASVDGTLATVEIDGVFPMLVTYDATVGAVTKYAVEGYATVELTASGRGFEGVVTVPHGHALELRYRIGGALGPGNAPGAPLDMFEVPEEYDRMALALIQSSVQQSPVTAGAFYERATSPSGDAYELRVLPADGPGFHFVTFDVPEPAGEWRFEHVAGGAGIVGAEMVFFHQYDVTLPEGTVSSPESGHEH